MGRPVKDLKGQRFGRLFVEGRHSTNKDRRATWAVRCDCGTNKQVIGRNLIRGSTKSCGCLSIEALVRTAKETKPRLKHGMSRTRVYKIWKGMKARCLNPKNSRYKDYGGRGIRVCDRWQEFENFLTDMGEPPEGMSMDRVDNEKGYEPGNCRWATRLEQNNNQRSNYRMAYNGTVKTLSEWARGMGIKKGTLFARIKNGWSISDSLNTPAGGCK